MYPLVYSYRNVLDIISDEGAIYANFFFNKSIFILLYESYMTMKDLIVRPYMDLIVCLDIRNQRLQFCVRFFV